MGIPKYLVFSALLAVTCAQPATAANPTFGAWQFFSDVGQRGTHFCGLMSAVNNKNIGQNIVIKGSSSEKNLVIDLYYDKWNRPQGETVKVMFDFVNNQPLTLSAFADAHILDIELPPEHTTSFLLALVKAPAMQVIFPDEDQDTWAVGSSGASDAIKQLAQCLRRK
jgi:hypothetical protein